MKRDLIWNGILVTSALPADATMAERAYRGVAYGRAWPLEYLEQPLTDEEKEMNRLVEELIDQYGQPSDGKYPPSVVSDLDVIKQYATYCQRRRVPVRLLLCATDSPYPELETEQAEKLLQMARFLGYDYVLHDCEFSALFDDLTPAPSPELAKFQNRLSRHGLLDNLDDLEEYVSARWSYVRSTGERFVETDHGLVRVTELEDIEGFWKCGVWEIPWPL